LLGTNVIARNSTSNLFLRAVLKNHPISLPLDLANLSLSLPRQKPDQRRSQKKVIRTPPATNNLEARTEEQKEQLDRTGHQRWSTTRGPRRLNDLKHSKRRLDAANYYGLALGCTVILKRRLEATTNTKEDGKNEGWENKGDPTASRKAWEKLQTVEPRDGRNPTDGTKEPNTDGRADAVIETGELHSRRRTLPTEAQRRNPNPRRKVVQIQYTRSNP
jgi:hypothetical protein